MKKYLRLAVCLLLVALLCLPLIACSEKLELSETLTVSGLTVELYSNGETVEQIVVFDGTQKKATIKCHGTSPAVVDLNFDGHDDLRFNAVDSDGTYMCFVYQPNIKSLAPNATLDSMLDPIWDHENLQINSRILKIEYYSEKPGEISGYRETRGNALWKLEGGVFKQVYESGIYHDSDGELYCVYEATLVDGVLTDDYASEKWYYADELAEAGYVW